MACSPRCRFTASVISFVSEFNIIILRQMNNEIQVYLKIDIREWAKAQRHEEKVGQT